MKRKFTLAPSMTPGKPIPARKRIPIITDMLEFRQMTGDPIGYCIRMNEKYGDVCYVPVPGVKNYFVHDPDIIREVLVTQAGKFCKSRLYRAMRKFLGDGLLTSEGSYHLQQRRLSTPAFHKQRIQQYAQTMVQCTLDEIQHWKEGDTINISQAMTNITLQIVTHTLFGSEIKADARKAVSENIGKLKLAGRIFQNPLYLICFEKDIRIPIIKKFYAQKEEIDKVIRDIIAAYRASGDTTQHDLLSMLMHATDEETGAAMTNEQIHDEVTTMFLAGHETTATALTWLWYTLAKNPGAEELFYREIKDKIGSRLPAADDYPALAYTKNAFKETLRLYPPVWTIAREAIEDIEIKGYHFPKGSVLCWLSYIMHRKEQYFEQPGSFRPGRWDNEQVPKFVYTPFGGGNRMCIGEGFAWMEAIMIMATIASKFRLELVKDFTTDIHPAFTLRPKDHIMMNVRQSY